MTLLEELKRLGLEADSFIVVGSGILEVLGIREAADIDIIASPEAYPQILGTGWIAGEGPGGKTVLRNDRFEVSTSWWTPAGEQGFGDLVRDALRVQGYLFVGLDYLYAWKKAVGRSKDLKDMELIDAYLARSGGRNPAEDLGSD